MKKDDEFYKDEPDDGSKSLIGAALLFSLVTVLLIVGAVLLLNKDSIKFKKNNTTAPNNNVSGYVNLDDYISGEDTVSDDLDIWNEYLDEKENEEDIVETVEEDIKEEEKKEEDLSEGGTKTKVVNADGSETWVNINKYLAPNELDNASFVLKNGRLDYYVEGEKASYTGIIVDKNDDYKPYKED